MIQKVKNIDMDPVSDLLRSIEYYFIIDHCNIKNFQSQIENDVQMQEQKYLSTEFMSYIRSNPNSKIGF